MPRRTRFAQAPTRLRWLAVLALAAWAPHAFGQKLQVRQSTALRELPSRSAATVATLPAQALIEGTGVRSGAWVQVRAPGGDPGLTHWVYLFDVQPLPNTATPTPAAQGSSAAAGLGSVFRGIGQLLQPSTSPRSVATTTAGVRGLGPEDLRQAAPDIQALQTLQDQRASDDAARQLAQERGWQARPAPVLPPVPRTPAKESLPP
ncbi:MAG: hypothetical protein ACT4NV_08960 [Rhodoferax sp.]